MSKNVFTDEALETFVNEIKTYADNAAVNKPLRINIIGGENNTSAQLVSYDGSSTKDISVANSEHDHDVATQNSKGFMSADDKENLDDAIVAVNDIMRQMEIINSGIEALDADIEALDIENAQQHNAIEELENDISQLSSEKADKSELVTINDVKETLADELSNNQSLLDNIAERVPYVKTAEQPTFVDSISEMTDTSKMYVLKSDAKFYTYKEHTTTTPEETTPNFTNQVPISTDTDGSIYNGTGYKENVRLSSSGGISGTAQNGSVTTGFIPWKNTDIIRIKGATWDNNGSGHYYFYMYDSSKTSCGYTDNITGLSADAASQLSCVYDETTGITTLSIINPNGSTGQIRQAAKSAAYFRINAKGKGEDLIVTVNEEISYTTTEGGTDTTHTWESTGISYNQPADYEGRVVIAEADIDRLENESAELTNRVNALENSRVESAECVKSVNGKKPDANGNVTIDVGEVKKTHTNLVPTSIDTDGSIYNGTGYKENVRLSSSGGISGSAQNGSVTTGFIPYVSGAVIRIKGAEIIDCYSKYNGHYYINFYNADKTLVYNGIPSIDNPHAALKSQYDESNGVEVLDTSGCLESDASTAMDVRGASFIRLTAYGQGKNLIVTVNEEITAIEEDSDNDNESCYNVQMNKLYADSLLKENTVLNNALETLCNRRDGSTQSRQVINLKKSEAQKLILHLHKRENDGYDTINDVYLPNAQNDFSDVRITTNTGKLLKYQTVYSGNIDVISDSRLGNCEVSFLSDGDGNLYIGRYNAAWKSNDAGKNWTKLNIGNIPSTERIRIVSFVCEDGTLFISTYGGLLYKSEPPYTSSRLVLDMTENGLYTGIGIRPFQFVQLPTGEMLLGSYQSEFAVRIWKSIDNGETWTKMYEDTEGVYQHVHRMYVDAYQNPVAVYAGLDRGWYEKVLDEETNSYYHTSGCVLRSTDGGSTWINLYEDQKGKPQAVDHGVIYADESGYRLLGGETAIVGGSSIVRTTDDIHFEAVLNADHSVYGAEKLNGHLFAAGCGCSSGKNATLYMSDDDGISWKQIYSEEPTLSDDIASAGIKTFHKGIFAGTNYEQLIAHNNIEEVKRASKRIICDDNSWYAEIIVDVPEGTTSLTVESGYMCPNLAVINNDVAISGEAVFVMDFNENGKYIKEKVSGEIYRGDHIFTDGGRHLGYIYPDVKSAADMKAIKMNSPIFDDGIKKKLNLNASDVGLTISFWLLSDINANFKIITHNSDTLYFDDGIWCNGRRIGNETINEGGRFVKVDIVIDGANNVIKSFSNGICTYTTSEQEKLDIVIPFLTGEKDYTLLKRVVDDDVLAIQHFEIRHGVPTDKEVYDSYFGGLTDNY